MFNMHERKIKIQQVCAAEIVKQQAWALKWERVKIDNTWIDEL
jgi:hypothetical protein